VTRVDLVLVHGAFHGPWCFDVVRPLLYERGIVAIAPELPLDSLAGDAAVVRDALDALDGKPRVILPYTGGFGAYSRRCDEVTRAGYPGFRLGRG
jgi:hypothetical protein